MKRRDFIKGAPATAALLLPSAAIAQPVESLTDRIARLTQELSAAMGEYADGKFKAIIGADDDITIKKDFQPSATARLAAEIQNVKMAMQEVYGVTPTDLSQLTINTGVVVLSALPHPMDRVQWFVDDGAPLLPNDKAWAEWLAERERLAPAVGGVL